MCSGGRDSCVSATTGRGRSLSKTHMRRVLQKDNEILGSKPSLTGCQTTFVQKDVSRIFRKLRGVTEPIRRGEPKYFVFNSRRFFFLLFPSYGNKSISASPKLLARQSQQSDAALASKTLGNYRYQPSRGNDSGTLGGKRDDYYCVDEIHGLYGGFARVEGR